MLGHDLKGLIDRNGVATPSGQFSTSRKHQMSLREEAWEVFKVLIYS